MKLLVLNGPNLNLLGQREPEIYGSTTIADIEAGLRAAFPDVEVAFQQHNSEGDLIDALHRAEADGVIFNPGGYAHTSVALHDAVLAIETPVVEVHISNVYARESFRHRLLIAPAAAGVITGFGVVGYRLAVEYFLDRT